MKITFYAEGIKEVKTNFSNKTSFDSQVEKFRQNMLAKHGLLFNKTPHVIQVTY